MSPKFAQTLYYLGALITPIVGILLIWGGISQGAADGINQIAGGATTLLATVAPATAAVRVTKQRKEGMFDATSPADAVASGVAAAIQNAVNANDELDKVKGAVTAAIGIVPGVLGDLGPLTSQLINMAVPAELLRPDVN